MTEDLFLNDVWSIYFHDPNDSNWTHSSYVHLGDISSVNDYWNHALASKDNIHKGMFFIMREHVFPAWDDPCNLKGGCLSLKVLKDDMQRFWEDLCIKLLGEMLVLNRASDIDWSKVNGISTSPKKHFCIVKIWLQDQDLNNKKYFDIMESYHGDILYKSNLDNIANDVQKETIINK